ncbi:hypothetical protein [Marinicella meishanensis]|uniref:hypothetical protein n=1 Tax=Marinicella meishanensis TaxID=2873263 RepID=UPI001CBF718E|nr:hypothetical protein [Marinicella sp. NBU2979]
MKPTAIQGFFGWSLTLWLLAVVGFWPGYFQPLWQQTFQSPVALTHVHAAYCFAWLTLMVLQAWLQIKHHRRWHRRLGLLGVIVAAGVVVTGVWLQAQFMQHYLTLGETQHAIQLPFFRLATLLVFAVCVVLALLISDRSWHPRLLLLGTLSLMQAAFARLYLHHLGVLELAGLYAAITHLVLMAFWVWWDRLQLGRFHAVSLWGTVLITAVMFGTAPLAQSVWWSQWAVALAAALG